MPIFDATPSDIKMTDDNMLIISGLPTFRIVGGCFEFMDKDKLRCKARGSNRVRVRIADLVGIMRAKK